MPAIEHLMYGEPYPPLTVAGACWSLAWRWRFSPPNADACGADALSRNIEAERLSEAVWHRCATGGAFHACINPWHRRLIKISFIKYFATPALS